jgi:O-antigen/teichoic acid export membrane protein
MAIIQPASSARRVKRNVAWNLAGSAAYALGQWLQLVILAQLDGARAVGAYAFALAFTAPVMVFASLCLRFLLASDAGRSYSFREYLSVRTATTVAAMVIIATLAWATGAAHGAWAVLAPVAVMRAADAISDIHYGLWQQRERMGVIACGMVINSAASVALMVLAVSSGGDVSDAAVAAAAGSVAALIFVRVRTVSDRELRFALSTAAEPLEWSRVGRLSRDAAPLGFTILLGSLQQNVPRFFVQGYGGAAALGVFAAAGQLTATADLVGSALAAAAVPRLGAHRAGRDLRSFSEVTRTLLATGAVVGVMGIALSMVAGEWFLVHLFGPEFAAGAPLLVVLSAAASMALLASLLGYALTAARIISLQPVLLTITVGVLTALSIVAVPRWGAIGAAWALVIATAVQVVVSWRALRRAVWKPEETGVTQLRRRTDSVDEMLQRGVAIPKGEPSRVERAAHAEDTGPIAFPDVRQAVVVAVGAGAAGRQDRPATHLGLTWWRGRERRVGVRTVQRRAVHDGGDDPSVD